MAKINSINIQIGDTVHSLSVKEAKELHQILGDFFEEKVVTVPTYTPWYQRPWPYVTWTAKPDTSGSFTIQSVGNG